MAGGRLRSTPVRYKNRNQVERGFGRRKQWRGLATRYDKLSASYQATVDIVETLDWLRAVPDHTPRCTSHALAGRPEVEAGGVDVVAAADQLAAWHG